MRGLSMARRIRTSVPGAAPACSVMEWCARVVWLKRSCCDSISNKSSARDVRGQEAITRLVVEEVVDQPSSEAALDLAVEARSHLSGLASQLLGEHVAHAQQQHRSALPPRDNLIDAPLRGIEEAGTG